MAVNIEDAGVARGYVSEPIMKPKMRDFSLRFIKILLIKFDNSIIHHKISYVNSLFKEIR